MENNQIGSRLSVTNSRRKVSTNVWLVWVPKWCRRVCVDSSLGKVIAKIVEDQLESRTQALRDEIKQDMEKCNSRITRKFNRIADDCKADADDFEADLKDLVKRVDDHDIALKRKSETPDITPQKKKRPNEKLIRSIKE